MDSHCWPTVVAIVSFCVVALCTASQPTCLISQTLVIPEVVNTGRTANTITVICVSTGPKDPISNPLWFLNGANTSETSCLTDDGINGNQLIFTITPDCEGYLQCGIQETCAVSLPQRLYGEPVTVFEWWVSPLVFLTCTCIIHMCM